MQNNANTRSRAPQHAAMQSNRKQWKAMQRNTAMQSNTNTKQQNSTRPNTKTHGKNIKHKKAIVKKDCPNLEDERGIVLENVRLLFCGSLRGVFLVFGIVVGRGHSFVAAGG